MRRPIEAICKDLADMDEFCSRSLAPLIEELLGHRSMVRQYHIATPIVAHLRELARMLRMIDADKYADWIEYCLAGWKEAEEEVWKMEQFLSERGLMYDWACFKHGAPNDGNRGPEDPPEDQSTGGRTGSDGGGLSQR